MFRDCFLGFLRLHNHALKEPIYGLDFIQELNQHHNHSSPGALYAIVHKLERERTLESQKRVVADKVRGTHRITPKGGKALREAYVNARELWAEIQEFDPDLEKFS